MIETQKTTTKGAKKWIWAIIGIAGIIALVVALRIIFTPAIHYSQGKKSFDEGQYAVAAEQFLAAGDYKDAVSKAKIATFAQNYAEGEAHFASGNYAEAVACFESAGNYEDAAERVIEAQYGVHYKSAEDAFACGDFNVAIAEFGEAQSFKDAEDRLLASTYALADEAEKNGKYEDAIDIFDSLDSYSDAKERIFTIGLTRLGAKDYVVAEKAFGLGSTPESENYNRFTPVLRFYTLVMLSEGDF